MASDWLEIPASEFCDSVRDGTHDSPKQVESGKLLVTSRHITGNRLDLSSAYMISDKDYEEINRRSKVDQWDVLYTMIGTVGEPCLVSAEPNYAIKNIGLFKNKTEVRGKYLYYYLCSPEAQHHTKAHSRGTTQQYIPLGALRKFPIRYPEDENEMLAITNILGSLDEKIELNRRMNETLEGMAQALFKSWFVDFDPVIDNILVKNMAKYPSPNLSQGERDVAGNEDGSSPSGRSGDEGSIFDGIPDEFADRAEVRSQALVDGTANREIAKNFPNSFQDTDEMGWIPEGWEIRTSGSLFDVRDGTHDSPKQSETGKYLITSRHITGETIEYSKAYLISDSDFFEVNKRSKVDSYDILLTMIGTVGIPFLVLENEISFAIKNVGLFKTGVDKVLATFFFTYLKLDFMTTFMESRLAGTTQKYLTLKILRGLPVTMPDSNIMREFGDQALPIFENIHSNNEETKTLTKLRDTLLPKLISGEVRTVKSEG